MTSQNLKQDQTTFLVTYLDSSKETLVLIHQKDILLFQNTHVIERNQSFHQKLFCHHAWGWFCPHLEGSQENESQVFSFFRSFRSKRLLQRSSFLHEHRELLVGRPSRLYLNQHKGLKLLTLRLFILLKDWFLFHLSLLNLLHLISLNH